MDLRVCDGGHSDGFQDALPGVALDLLHAEAPSVQGLSSDQSVGSFEPSVAVGFGVGGDLPQQALPVVVWLWRTLEVLGEAGVYQHHHLSTDFPASGCVLCAPSGLLAHRQIHHPNCKHRLLALGLISCCIFEES